MIYFDSAATTLEKPPAVAAAMAQTVGELASPGRGGYAAARGAEELLYRCRCLAAEFFDAAAPEQVVFTTNATHGLNIAIRSLVRPGSRVVISGYEHNAVTRPLWSIPALQCRCLATPLFAPEVFLRETEQALARGADTMICCHVSNVFGYILPVEEVARLCRRYGTQLIVDASQSAGILPISQRRWQASFVAMPGHKGLYGPQGTGLLLCAAATEPLLYGGTGILSAQMTMPDFLPERLEAGTMNLPGIAGLYAGLSFLQSRGTESLRQREEALREVCARGLGRLPGAEVFSQGGSCQSGVLSFRLAGVAPQEVGDELARQGIAVRCGLHCAPLAHQTAGTLPEGTVRLSFSAFNTREQAEIFLARMRDFCRRRKV